MNSPTLWFPAFISPLHVWTPLSFAVMLPIGLPRPADVVPVRVRHALTAGSRAVATMVITASGLEPEARMMTTEPGDRTIWSKWRKEKSVIGELG